MHLYLILLFWLITFPIYAQAIEVNIGQPPDQSISGTQLLLPVYFQNPEEKAVVITVPHQLTCQLSVGDSNFELTAQQEDSNGRSNVSIEGKQYIKIHYTLQLPPLLEGVVRLHVPDLTQTPIWFRIDADPTFASDETPTPQTEITGQKTELSKFINIYQPYVENISFYEPMYFLVGTNPEDSKFQFSFKYRLFNSQKPLAQNHPWIDGIHFAYTQTSFWDLASESQPFKDTSYKPEFFFLSPNIPTGLSWLNGCFIQTGLQHESNGREEVQSRSTNYAYLEPSFIYMDEREMTGLKISPRFHLYLANDDETNRDLPDYRGYFNLGATFGIANSIIVDSQLGWAKAGGSVQVDLTYPLHRLFRNNLDIYLQFEYTNTLAERLIRYDQRVEAVRIGFAIVR